MKQVLSFLTIFFFTATAGAQSKGQSDPNAKKILDAVSAKFKTYKGVKATFTYKNEDNKGKVLGSKTGTLYMKGNKYRVTLNGGQDIFCDGATISTYDASSNEVTLTKFDPVQSTITPQKLFTNFYDKDFLYKLNGEKKEAGKVLQEIELTPYDKNKSFFKVYVLVDKAASTIYSSKVLEKNGVNYTYTVSSLNGNADVQDATFIFDKKKYPGVEVIDLR